MAGGSPVTQTSACPEGGCSGYDLREHWSSLWRRIPETHCRDLEMVQLQLAQLGEMQLPGQTTLHTAPRGSTVDRTWCVLVLPGADLPRADLSGREVILLQGAVGCGTG